jgi:hypothetical protein
MCTKNPSVAGNQLKRFKLQGVGLLPQGDPSLFLKGKSFNKLLINNDLKEKAF